MGKPMVGEDQDEREHHGLKIYGLDFPDTLLWNGLIDNDQGNTKKTRGLRGVVLQEDIGDLMGDQQSSDGTNEEKLNEHHQEKRTITHWTHYEKLK